MTDIVTVGWLTVDDIVLGDGTCRKDVLGGGALYSAVGAQIWNDAVAIHSVTGRPYVDYVRGGIEARGIDASAIGTVEGNGLQLWLLHESDTHKQQVPKLSSSSAAEMDHARGPLPLDLQSALGFHIAPQSPAGSLSNAERLHALPGRPVVTLDLLSDRFIDATLYRDLRFLHHVTAFLPSEAEVERIWTPPDLRRWMRQQATAHGCHIVMKCGEQGSLVCAADNGEVVPIPAYPARVIDTTGAGDAFCGGFLAGLVADHPLIECAAMGTVSASYVVEACGALATARPASEDRRRRLETVMAGVAAS